MVTGTKLSQIQPASAPPALTDQLVGVGGGTTDLLYSVSQVQSSIGRTLLTANTNYYVTSTGNDSNNGSVGSPWFTILHAMHVIAETLDLASFTVTVNVGPGLFDGFAYQSFVGGGIVRVVGAGSAATTIQTTNTIHSGCCVELSLFSTTLCAVDKVTLDNTLGNGPDNPSAVTCTAGPALTVGDIFNGPNDVNFVLFYHSFALYCAGSTSIIYLGGGGTASYNFGCAITPANPFGFPFGLIFCEFDSALIITADMFVTGSPAWGSAACRTSTSAHVIGNSGIGHGTATLASFTAEFSSDIDDNFAGLNWFPGTEYFTDGTSRYGSQQFARMLTYVDTDHTLSPPTNSGDFWAIIEMQSAAAHVFTIPTNASMSANFPPTGLSLPIVQKGTAAVTIQAAAGVTLNGVLAGSVTTAGQYTTTRIYQSAPDNWIATAGF